jgi:hypothetical protein
MNLANYAWLELQVKRREISRHRHGEFWGKAEDLAITASLTLNEEFVGLVNLILGQMRITLPSTRSLCSWGFSRTRERLACHFQYDD